jgi:hypothetical protein
MSRDVVPTSSLLLPGHTPFRATQRDIRLRLDMPFKPLLDYITALSSLLHITTQIQRSILRNLCIRRRGQPRSHDFDEIKRERRDPYDHGHFPDESHAEYERKVFDGWKVSFGDVQEEGNETYRSIEGG